MTQQPEALRLADDLDAEFVQGHISNHTGRKAAAELRRLHEENEHLKLVKFSFEMKLATRGYELQIDDLKYRITTLKARITTLEAALTQAVEALGFAYNACESDWVQDEKIWPAITAAKQALGKADAA